MFAALALAALLAGCAGTSGSDDASVYRTQITPSLLRLDGAASLGLRAIQSFERGRSSFLAAHRRVTAADKKLAVTQKLMVAIAPPQKYASAHEGLLRSAGLLRVAFSTYDRYLQNFVLAVAAFKQAHRGQFEAQQATRTYGEYALRLRGFEAVAKAAASAAPEAILFPADVVGYAPPSTVVYVTRQGVVAGSGPIG